MLLQYTCLRSVSADSQTDRRRLISRWMMFVVFRTAASDWINNSVIVRGRSGECRRVESFSGEEAKLTYITSKEVKLILQMSSYICQMPQLRLPRVECLARSAESIRPICSSFLSAASSVATAGCRDHGRRSRGEDGGTSSPEFGAGGIVAPRFCHVAKF